MDLRRDGVHPPDQAAAIWLGAEHGSEGDTQRRVWWRTALGMVSSIVVIAVVAVPVALVLSSARSTTSHGAKLASGPAQHRVLSALSATIASGSFNMTYSEEPPTTPTSGTSGVGPQGLVISGQGTIDTNPFAMVAASNVPGFGLITTRADGTNVWEVGGGNYGLSPGSSSSGPGAPLSGFASLVEGTLGPRQGAIAMLGLANPTGYLELDQNAISAANQTGTGVVDGVPVTVYQVTIDPAQQADAPGATPEEAAAIRDALDVLQQQGYRGMTDTVSIDGAGYIRQLVAVASFTDGAIQTSEATLSDFGCAGRVLMPGQSGSTSPPSGCVSPNTASTSP